MRTLLIFQTFFHFQKEYSKIIAKNIFSQNFVLFAKWIYFFKKNAANPFSKKAFNCDADGSD